MNDLDTWVSTLGLPKLPTRVGETRGFVPTVRLEGGTFNKENKSNVVMFGN